MIRRTTQPALTKQDLVGYIGPVFEELKGDIRELKTGFRSLAKRIDNKTHRLEVMIDVTKREVMDALETYSAVSAKETTVKEHGERIAVLEKDLSVVKTILRK